MKKLIRTLLIALLLLLLLGVGSNFYIKHRISQLLEEEKAAGALSYSNLEIDLFSGSVTADSMTYKWGTNQQIRAKQVEANGFSYLNYWLQHKIRFKELYLDHPDIQLQKSPPEKNNDRNNQQNIKQIKVGTFTLKKAALNLQRDTLTEIKLKDYDLSLKKLLVKKNSADNRLTLGYQDIQLEGGATHIDLGALQNLEVEKISANSNDIELHELHLRPKYSRQAYTRVIAHQEDLMDIEVKMIQLQDYHIDLNSPDGGLSASKILLDKIKANIYHDRTLPDDPTKKEMYSGMLRNLKLGLNIDSVQVRNADLAYEELQEKTNEIGKVFFNNMHIDIGPITNRDLKRKDFPETKVVVLCDFYGSSPLQVDWTFKINDEADHFNIRGATHHISSDHINLFFIPAFNLRAEGDGIGDLYFNFSGDNQVASGNFKMVYENLKVEVLKKDSKEKRGFLSFLGNIFVKHKNTADEKQVEVTNVERDSTKSFWNYLWQCIFSGLDATLLP